MACIILSKAAFLAALSLVVMGSPTPDVTSQRASVQGGYYVPAYYPAPYGGWVQDWQESYRKGRELVNSMTLAEKTNITAGSGIFMGQFCTWSVPSRLALGMEGNAASKLAADIVGQGTFLSSHHTAWLLNLN